MLPKTVEECKDEVDLHLENLRNDMASLKETAQSIKEIHDDIKQVREILDAWNSAKGFATTVKFLATMFKWSAMIVITIGGLWYFLRTGHMPDVKGP